MPTRCISNDSGVALLFVLWVLVFLSIVTGVFCFSSREHARAAFYEGLHTKARYIAHAGIQKAVAGLVDEARYKKPTRYRINVPLEAEPFDGGTYRIFIANESGKINLNQADAGLLRMLLNRSDISDNEKAVIVDSIMDWRDKDNMHRLNGAENDYYASLPEPYRCRSGNFITVTELFKVRGMTREIFEGCMKGCLSVKRDENELLPEKSSIQEYLQLENRSTGSGIQTFLTLEKRREANKLGKLYDYSKININAASPRMLSALPGMSERMVQKVLEYRKEKDFSSISDVQALVGNTVYNRMKDYIFLSLSRYYTITCVAGIDGTDIEHRIKMDIWLDNTASGVYKVLQRY